MEDADLTSTGPAQIGSLLSLPEGEVAWSAADLADLFRHQMSLPLATYLRPSDPAGRQTFDEALAPLRGPETSLGDLLAAGQPPVVLLWVLKDFAKTCDQDAHGPLPAAVATALYYSAIAAALAGHGVFISNLPRKELRRGVLWAAAQEWVPAEVRSLLAGAARLLGDGPDS